MEKNIRMENERLYLTIALPKRDEFEQLIKEFHNNMDNTPNKQSKTRETEGLGEKLYKQKKPSFEEIRDFTLKVIAWGNVARWAKGQVFHKKNNREEKIVDSFHTAIQFLYDDNIANALNALC